MTRRFPKKGALRLLQLAGVSLLSLVLLGAALAFAQNVIVDPAPAPASTSIVGWLMVAGFGLLIAIGAWVAAKATSFFQAQVDQAKAGTLNAAAWGLTQRIWLKAQTIVAKLATREKALVEKILSDGKVTPEEFAELKSRVVTDLEEILVAEIPLIGSLLGIVGPANVRGFLEGIAGKVTTNLLTGKTALPEAAPVAPASPK